MNGPDTRTSDEKLADALREIDHLPTREDLARAWGIRPTPAPANRDERRRYAALSRRSQTR